mmetsp:Transcript_68865/g.212989  ORF Transcript_68865/g.212989 Transcript_68865/m.212989 type:complete len:456 (-) Transcript_68865:319-1686(-)
MMSRKSTTESSLPRESSEQPGATGKRCTYGSAKVLWLIVSVAFGLCIGLGLSRLGLGRDHWLITLLALPGKLWLKGLTCMVLPMIIFSMITAMVMLRSLPGARYLGLMVMGCYLLTTLVAAGEGCFVSAVILGPNVQQLPQAAAAAAATDLPVAKRSLLETVVAAIENLVPKNLVGDAAAGNLLPVIIASIVFGLLVESKREDGAESVTMRLINELNGIVVRVITFLMSVTPFGVGSLVFASAARLNFAEMGSNVGFLLAATACGLLLHACVFYPALLLLVARRNPLAYFFNITPAMATALGTSSSAATLPVSISCAVERNGVSPPIASFVLSLGATVNMDGTTVYLICATCFLGALHGISFGISKFLLTTVMATLCSMGSAPLPSASLVLLATILSAVGVPLDETFGLITAVDWMLDRLRTCVNVAGDACAAGVIDACGSLRKQACAAETPAAV